MRRDKKRGEMERKREKSQRMQLNLSVAPMVDKIVALMKAQRPDNRGSKQLEGGDNARIKDKRVKNCKIYNRTTHCSVRSVS